jgi:hypothetical protein
MALTWDRQRVVTLDSESLQPIEGEERWPVVGGGPLPLEF